jgi:PAS domain S-box-containing protein
MSQPAETTRNNDLHRFHLDNALDAFIAIDSQGRIIEWSRQAEQMFGWRKDEILTKPAIETLIPSREQKKYARKIHRLFASDDAPTPRHLLDVIACHRDGHEIPIELGITPIWNAGQRILLFSARDISGQKRLEHDLQYHADLTQSILDCMPDAVAVADITGRLILVNPAAQRLLNLQPLDKVPGQTYHNYQLLQADEQTSYPESERPMVRALRGEHVQGMLALVRHEDLNGDVWVSVNARPLRGGDGKLAGGIAVYHDITELRQRETELRQQAHVLHKRVSLLELSHDAIVTCDMDDNITFWNHRAEDLYGIDRSEALGRNYNELLQTQYPVPLAEIKAIVHEKRRWQGEVKQRARNGQEIIVISQWALEFRDGIPWRYLQTHTDITENVHTEQALRESQENYRLLVDTTTDFAIIMMDPEGIISSWNSGAEKILGMSADEAVGRPISAFCTPEDRAIEGVALAMVSSVGESSTGRMLKRVAYVADMTSETLAKSIFSGSMRRKGRFSLPAIHSVSMSSVSRRCGGCADLSLLCASAVSGCMAGCVLFRIPRACV